MGLFSKRLPQDDQIGRRRPAPQQPRAGQNRTFSYYASRSDNVTNVGRLLTQQEAPKRRRSQRARAFARRLPFILASVAIFASIASELNLGGQPRIVTLAASATHDGKLFLRPTYEYQKAATELFHKSLSNRNKLTVDASGISTKLKDDFPELNDVSVALPLLGRRPIVYIQPANPTMILASAGKEFIIDDNGRAMLDASTVPQLGTLHLPTVTDASSLQIKVGQTALPSTETAFVQTIVSQLQAQHIGIKRMVLPAAANEIDVYISGKPYFVKFNVQNQPLQQVGTFVATMRHVSPAHYFDVRIDGRVYYK